MKEQLRAWWLEERRKLRRLDTREKLKYIRQYYLLWIIGIIGVVWLAVYTIVHLGAGPPQYWIYAALANSTAIAGNNSRIWRDFVEYSGYDTDEKKVEFSTNMYFDYNRNQARGNEYYNAFVALTDTGTLDIITMDPEQLAPLGQSGRLLSWNEEACSGLRKKYADRLIWYEPPEDAEGPGRFPVGIDVSDSRLVTEYHVYPEAAALGIGVQSTRLDAVGVFLDFIFSKE